LKNQLVEIIGKITDASSSRSPETGWQSHGIFLPLCLFAVALVGWFGFQTVQLVNERSLLKQTHASQEAQVQQSAKLRTALDALAADTARLAEGGNANAKILVDELRKRNITINPNAVPAK
jgi:hypothetical protein